MTSTAQVASNQQNAKLSTGPRTDEGKAVSSQNGITHGLSSTFRVLVHENQSEFDSLQQTLAAEFHPEGEHETFLVNQMAQSRWRLTRITRLETAAFDCIVLGEDAAGSNDPDIKIIAAMSKGDRDPLPLLERYRASAERAYYKAHHELTANRRAIQKEQAAAHELAIRAAVYGPTAGEIESLCQAGLASKTPVDSSNQAYIIGFASHAPNTTPNPTNQVA